MSGFGEDFWRWVTETAAALDERSYYELLAVGADAPAATIAEAYYGLVRKVHPDRHPRERDPERRRALVRLYARLGEAHRVLSAPPLRARYDRALGDGSVRLSAEEERKPDPASGPDPKTPHARALFDKGKELLAAGDARGARAQWQLALGFEPRSKVLAEALAGLDSPRSSPAAASAPPASPVASGPPATPVETAPAPAAPAPPVAPVESSPPATSAAAPPPSRPIKLRCATWDQLAALYRRDLRRGSLFLRTGKPLPAGTAVELRLALPNAASAAIPGAVTRAESAGSTPGMEIRLEDGDARADLVRLLRVHAPAALDEENR